MDSYEATRIVFSKVQSLDPENGSKIMGYILIQDHGDKEMIRLALGPESLLHQLIVKAKTHLGLVSCSSPAPATATPSPAAFSPFSRVALPSSLSIPASGSRFAGGFDFGGVSSPASSGGWPVSGFSDHRSPMSPNGSLSYANVVNGSLWSGSVSGSCLSPGTFSYYGAGGNSSGDEYNLSFLNDQKGDDFIDYGGESQSHRRSYSVPGVFFGSPPEDPSGGGFGWKPCLYFARGFCKNGSACRFLHSGDGDGDAVGSPEQCHEHLMRSKSAAFAAVQQQELAAGSQFIAGVGAATFPYTKCVNFLQQENENQRSAAAALMIGDELMKFGRCRPERSDFPAMGLNNPGSRQIYLTFPADSTFREEDVSNYFSIYGPVHDVRIPYQQKRMFGFVTFVYPETVKLILAKGNPHFVCDSRVLVKPYKEKGKIIDKKMQHMDRGDYMGCSSPTGDLYELNLGAKMFYNSQEMLLKRKLEEQADLQQAIELQERRLMNLQLLDLKNHHRHHQNFHQDLAVGSPINSPTISHNSNNGSQVRVPSPDDMKPKSPEENGGSPVGVAQEETNNGGCNGNGKEEEKEKANNDECDLHESLEHILPDNLFASPKKSGGDNLTAFSSSDDDTSSTTTSALNMAPLKSCFLQIPRFSSGHGAIGL